MRGRIIKKFKRRKFLYRHQCFVSIELRGMADAAASLMAAVSFALFGVEAFMIALWRLTVEVVRERDEECVDQKLGKFEVFRALPAVL